MLTSARLLASTVGTFTSKPSSCLPSHASSQPPPEGSTASHKPNPHAHTGRFTTPYITPYSRANDAEYQRSLVAEEGVISAIVASTYQPTHTPVYGLPRSGQLAWLQQQPELIAIRKATSQGGIVLFHDGPARLIELYVRWVQVGTEVVCLVSDPRNQLLVVQIGCQNWLFVIGH